MTAIRLIWLGLAVLAAGWGFLFGVPLWLSFVALSCAITPPTAGIFLTGSVKPGEVAAFETALWVAAATAAVASTGGVSSPLTILYAVGIGVAWISGERRLAAETAGFSLIGYVAAAIAGAQGTWIDPSYAETLSAAFGACGLAMAGIIAALALAARQVREPAPSASPADSSLALKLRQTESRASRAETELAACRDAATDAKARLDARTRFFAQTSHELRTPLNAINGFAEMMKNGIFGPLSERYQEYAELIHEGGRNLNLVVDDVLELSRIDQGKYEIAPEVISLTDHADAAVHFMADMAARKSVTLTMDGDDDVEAFADAKAVRQIALNLISNALKFTPEGGQVMVSAVETSAGALLAVADTGVGISEEELTRLSRAFEQGAEGRKQKGSGLGLSVVRAFAELHGGRLDIESREGGGTTIGVFFPAEKQVAAG